MTTPDTSAVRAWARDNGFDVAARGRLPTAVVDAYTARRKKKAAPARRPASEEPAATPAAAPSKRGAQAPAKRSAAKRAKAPATAAPAPAPETAAASVDTAAPTDPTEVFADASLDAISADPPVPHPAAAPDDEELQRLVDQVRELSERVAALEASADAQPQRPVTSRSRRQR